MQYSLLSKMNLENPCHTSASVSDRLYVVNQFYTFLAKSGIYIFPSKKTFAALLWGGGARYYACFESGGTEI